jgi:hypothetical protein
MAPLTISEQLRIHAPVAPRQDRGHAGALPPGAHVMNPAIQQDAFVPRDAVAFDTSGMRAAIVV